MDRDVPDPVVQPGRYLSKDGSELILRPVFVIVNLEGRRIESSRYTFNASGVYGGALVPANEREHRKIQQMIDDLQMTGPLPVQFPEPDTGM